MHTKQRQSGFGALLVLVLILVVVTLGASALLVYRHRGSAKTKNTTTSTKQQTGAPGSQAPVDVYAGWKTYASATENATFKYPSNWTLTQPAVAPVSGDATGIASPSGVLTITWDASTGGLGNEHSSSYPSHTVVDRTPIPNAAGFFVVSGITTLDGSTYHPWIAIQDSNGINQSGVAGDVVTFKAKHAFNTSTNDLANALLSTSGIRASQSTPALTQAQATAWFSGTEAQQAKLVLLSFKDPS